MEQFSKCGIEKELHSIQIPRVTSKKFIMLKSGSFYDGHRVIVNRRVFREGSKGCGPPLDIFLKISR